jgi:hypothetical protein
LKSQEEVCKIKYGFEVPGRGLQTRTLIYILPPGTSDPYIILHTPSWVFKPVLYFTYSLLGLQTRTLFYILPPGVCKIKYGFEVPEGSM